jgi:hypothetical protein
MGGRGVVPEGEASRLCSTMMSETKYAQSGTVNIAYQVLGDGPIDLVMAPGWIFHLELVWEDPSFERTINRFLPNFRVILFDKRGTGLSDRAPGASTIEERMDDVRAVMDAVGSKSGDGMVRRWDHRIHVRRDISGADGACSLLKSRSVPPTSNRWPIAALLRRRAVGREVGRFQPSG